jgi:hypothetical protein
MLHIVLRMSGAPTFFTFLTIANCQFSASYAVCCRRRQCAASGGISVVLLLQNPERVVPVAELHERYCYAP